MALVAVLAVLVLLTVLVVAFLVRAQLARNNAASYHATTSTRLLADTVVNLVEAEINDATTYGSGGTGSGTAPYTWASQPGAIRVYDSSGGGSGASLGLQKIYRLYSAPALTTSNVGDIITVGTGSVTSTELNPSWATLPAQWVDLNAPVLVSDPATATTGTVYPILDPRNPASPNNLLTTSTGTAMPGFNLTSAPTSGTTNPAPMPVQWLYVLQNGQIIAPSTASGSTVSFTGSITPSASNPIIGRIAYWTDDETCKVNINTAAGSVSYRTSSAGVNTTTPVAASWDTPRYGGSWEDVKLFGENQPVQGEYQRYPGHPATTVLYYILNGLGVPMPEISTAFTPNEYKAAYNGSVDTQDGGSLPWPYTSSLYLLLPRYNDNAGSQAGIANTTVSNSPTLPSMNRSRLYTSLGELLYSTNASSATPPVRTMNGEQGESGTGLPGISAPYLTRQQVETGKFFLTAHSSAPEETLFGTPRVSMWPIPDTASTPTQGTKMAETTYDKLFAFCCTTDTGKAQAGDAYYFKRYDSASPTNDWTNAAEARNPILYSYLQALTSSNIPGYPTGSFSSKYGSSIVSGISSERDQILTEMVDYIRSTNLNDHSWTGTFTTNPLPTGQATYGYNAQVIPLQITSNGTAGLGRIETISEAALALICTADGNSPLTYQAPVINTTVHATIPVSPVAGSANDPKYVSNLTQAQWLRTTSGTGSDGKPGTIVDVTGHTVGTTTPATFAFPANPTLATPVPNPSTGNYNTTLTQLTPGHIQVQAALLFEMGSPMQGFDLMSGQNVRINVSNIQNILVNGTGVFPSQTTTANTGSNLNGNGYYDGSAGLGWVRHGGYNDFGGVQGFMYPLHVTSQVTGTITTVIGTGTAEVASTAVVTGTTPYCSRFNGWSGLGGLYCTTGTATDPDDTQAISPIQAALGTSLSANTKPIYQSFPVTVPYRFISNPFTVPSGGTMGLSGGCTAALQLPTGTGSYGSGTYGNSTHNVTYQTFTINFPSQTVPVPALPVNGLDYSNISGTSTVTCVSHAIDWWGFDNRIGWLGDNPNGSLYGSATYANPNLNWESFFRTDTPNSSYTPPATWSLNGSHGQLVTTLTNPDDVVRSIIAKDGDYRLAAAQTTVTADPTQTASAFSKPPSYGTSTIYMTHLLTDAQTRSGMATFPGGDITGTLTMLPTGVTYAPWISPKVASVLSSGTPSPWLTFDWDSGLYTTQDGAYANKPDEGSTYNGSGVVPYINLGNQGTITSYFTANRLVASPVAFGSLPTGVAEEIPWRTLLFRPQLNRTTYTGQAAAPKDYLFLDDFWMPVVQPYAISEPFSTEGKINMNYQILPFTYINRSTGIQAVLGSELVARVPSVDAGIPTAGNGSGNPQPVYEGAGLYPTQTNPQTGTNGMYPQVNASHSIVPARLPLNLSTTNGTLRQFVAKFNNGDIFRSPAEICDIYLVPYDQVNTGTYTDWTSDANADNAVKDSWYGADFGLVGDNVREKPYSDMYPRLTTKSNCYTVHFKVQALKNPPGANPAQWTEGQGVVLGEYRGSTTIERYLDPNNNNIPDYTTSANNPAVTANVPTLDNYYQWRTVANYAFAP